MLIGGCRNEEDQQRVDDLMDLCKHLSVEENVDFKVCIMPKDILRCPSRINRQMLFQGSEIFFYSIFQLFWNFIFAVSDPANSQSTRLMLMFVN